MSRVVALDTETTGLDPEREDVFEIATIDLDSGVENVWHIEPRPEVVEAMHPVAAEVNRYHERTSDPDWVWHHPQYVLGYLADELAGVHILGAVPDFGTRHLTALYRRFDAEPPQWHYHLIDIEAMALGYLWGIAEATVAQDREVHRSADYSPSILGRLPWRSDDLSRACGIEPPSDEDRHTALGDARWCADLYRHITGQEASRG